MADDFSIGGLSAGQVAGVAQGAINAVGSLFGGSVQSTGYQKEADLYNQAADLENWNVQYSQESTRVKEILAARQAQKVIGAQTAAVGAAGFEESGSNLYLRRDSEAQAAITRGMIDVQGGIEAANFQEQGIAYKAQAAGAEAQAQAAQGGGILGALSGIAGIAAKFIPGISDMRLKEDIKYLRTQNNGIRWYSFKFIGHPGKHIGVMAQELLDIMPEAVIVGEDGYYRVDYAQVLRSQ